MCFKLIDETRIDIIKGNASEVARIAGADVRTKGVDSGDVSGDLVKIATGLAVERDCTVIITGKDDIITDGKKCITVSNGHELMSHVVGTGCMAASVAGTFAAVDPGNIVEASAAGLCCLGIAAELAVSLGNGPGSFKGFLFDAIYSLDRAHVDKMKRTGECAVTIL
jgi:hydroxyethylthiazole kinase